MVRAAGHLFESGLGLNEAARDPSDQMNGRFSAGDGHLLNVPGHSGRRSRWRAKMPARRHGRITQVTAHRSKRWPAIAVIAHSGRVRMPLTDASVSTTVARFRAAMSGKCHSDRSGWLALSSRPSSLR